MPVKPYLPLLTEPDWLKGLGESEAVPAASQTEEPDWLKGLGGNEASSPQFLKQRNLIGSKV